MRVAKIASVVIAVFSFAIAPLLSLAAEGLWQVIRIFTGFYNIPTIVIDRRAVYRKGSGAGCEDRHHIPCDRLRPDPLRL